MKKLFGFLAIVLTGLLIFAACPNGTSSGTRLGTTTPDTTPVTTPDNVKLEKAIKEANDVKWDKNGQEVKVKANASEVAEGVLWVTEAEMDALDAAIKAVNDSRSIRSVDAVIAALEAAIATFKAKLKPGAAPAITLSGTITITNKGKPVPYVYITAHGENWRWSEQTRLPSSSPNTPWSIIVKKSEMPSPSVISFRVNGYADDNYDYFNTLPLFGFSVKDPSKTKELTVNYSDTDISKIDIVMALNTITLSGTISGSYDGKPIPYVNMQVINSYDYSFLGETTAALMNVGNNVPWSIVIDALDEEISPSFAIYGHTGPWWDGELFTKYGEIWPVSPEGYGKGDTYDYPGRTVKDRDVSNIKIMCNFYPNLGSITLSGTINVTYDGNPVDDLTIFAETIDNATSYRLYGYADIQQPGSSAPWSITIDNFDQNVVEFYVNGFKNFEYSERVFYIKDITTRMVRDQKNRSGIVLDLGEMKGTEWDLKK
jgi:hypothetical protein